MFTWYTKTLLFHLRVTISDLQCVWLDTQQTSKASKWMLWLLKNNASLHLPLLLLPHFLTLVFSSSPFFRLPQSPEFAAGQKAAAEAQPIWSAAPPSWRSERREGRRLVVNQTSSTSSTHTISPDLLNSNLQCTCILVWTLDYEICMYEHLVTSLNCEISISIL